MVKEGRVQLSNVRSISMLMRMLRLFNCVVIGLGLGLLENQYYLRLRYRVFAEMSLRKALCYMNASGFILAATTRDSYRVTRGQTDVPPLNWTRTLSGWNSAGTAIEGIKL